MAKKAVSPNDYRHYKGFEHIKGDESTFVSKKNVREL